METRLLLSLGIVTVSLAMVALPCVAPAGEVTPPASSSMEALAEISLSCLSVPRLRGVLSYPAALSILPVRKHLVQQRRRVLPRNASVRQWDQAHTPPGYDSVWDCHGGVTFYNLEV